MKPHIYNKTEECIFTLLSLSILITQALDSLYGEEDILESDFDRINNNFYELVNDTIHEALVYQILLKGCAYLDEWNKVFGVQTELQDKDRIIEVKRAALPASKCIARWKQLREFRNHYIAHNHRDQDGYNVYLKGYIYDSPQSNEEVFLFVYCIKTMTDIMYYFFEKEVTEIAKSKFPRWSDDDLLHETINIREEIARIDREIRQRLSN